MLKCLNAKMLKCEKGALLYFALVIMVILLAIGLSLSVIIIGQLRMIKGMGDSVVALHAADTGIEEALYALYKVPNTTLPFGRNGYLDLNQNTQQDPNEPTYQVNALARDTVCPAPAQYYCLRSIGTYLEVRRAIEASR